MHFRHGLGPAFLEAVLQPQPLGRIRHVSELGADRAAVDLAQLGDDVAQLHALGDRVGARARVEDGVEIRVAQPEMRELEVFSGLLERRGAAVLRCPLVTIYDSPHSAQVLAFAVALADGNFDDFVLITGEGLTRILSCIDKYEPAL